MESCTYLSFHHLHIWCPKRPEECTRSPGLENTKLGYTREAVVQSQLSRSQICHYNTEGEELQCSFCLLSLECQESSSGWLSKDPMDFYTSVNGLFILLLIFIVNTVLLMWAKITKGLLKPIRVYSHYIKKISIMRYDFFLFGILLKQDMFT